MAELINVKDAAPQGVPMSLEPIDNINGVPVSLRHVQPFLLAVRTAAGTMYHAVATAAFGILVDVSRISGLVSAREPNTTGVAISKHNVDNVAEVTLIAANSGRRGLQIYNDSATARLMVKYGAGAAADDWTFRLKPNGHWEMPQPIHSGIVSGIWDTADAAGKARVTEQS